MPTALDSPATRLRVLLPSMAVLAFAVFASHGAILTVLLPNQIEALDPINKVANLALVSTISFTFTIFSQPLVGALSDRTRTRLGRRMPWIILGSMVGGGFLLGMGGFASVLWICVFWVVVQFALNAVDVSFSAYVPDRFPRNRRGFASAVLGAGAISGGAIGAVVAGRLVDELELVYSLLGIVLVLAMILFVVCNRDDTSTDTSVARLSWRTFFSSFWINPRRYPNFAWAFAARFFFILGYDLVYTFMLYVLTDYIELPRIEANLLIGALMVVTMVTIMASVVFSGWWSDRLGRRTEFLVAASVLLMVALAVPIFSPTVTGMVVFAAVKGIAFGTYLACGNALVTEVLPDERGAAGKDLGLFNVAINVPQALAPSIAGLIIVGSGGYVWLFATAIVGVGISAVLVSRVRVPS